MTYTNQRRSVDSVWPLCAADGRTFAQVKKDRLAQEKKRQEESDAAFRDEL